MARGDWEKVTGRIVRDRHLILLRVDDGGEWELDLLSRHHQFIGQRVTVEGRRSGYRLIDVDRVARLISSDGAAPGLNSPPLR